MSEKCLYCKRPAARYCDFKIGGAIGGYQRLGPVADNTFYACFDVEQLPFRCDIPMCEDHAKQVGMMFMKGNNDSIDFCPEHVGKDECAATPCTEDEAREIRRSIHAKARRRGFVLASTSPEGANNE